MAKQKRTPTPAQLDALAAARRSRAAAKLQAETSPEPQAGAETRTVSTASRPEPQTVRVFTTPKQAPKAVERDAYPGWDGTEMGFKLGHPMIMDLVVVGPGDRCLSCDEPDHQVHAKVSPVEVVEFVDGVRTKRVDFVGPDAENVRAWFRFGLILDTPEYEARQREQAEIDALRGTYGTKENPGGFPSLQALTTDRLRAQHQQALGAGPKAARLRERQEVRAATAELVEVLKMLGVDTDAWVGAQATGSRVREQVEAVS